MVLKHFKSFNKFYKYTTDFLTKKEKYNIYVVYKKQGLLNANIQYILTIKEKLKNKTNKDINELDTVLNISYIDIKPIFNGYKIILKYDDIRKERKEICITLSH